VKDAAMHMPCPRADDLAFEPELASLALLDAAIAVTIQALIAQNPELLHERDEGHHPPPQVFAARGLIAVFRELHAAMQLYRDLRPAPPEPSDDIPF
jgi:hypothetical protein